MLTPKEILELDRQATYAYAAKAGRARVAKLLITCARELEDELANISPSSQGTYGEVQLRATLRQVRDSLGPLLKGMRSGILDLGKDAAEYAADSTLRSLQAGEDAYGTGQPLAIDHAAFFDSSIQGARSSILRRLGSSGTSAPGAPEVEHKAKAGILQRYGMNVIGDFEHVLRKGMIQRKSWDDMRDELVTKSPFLQGAPAHWAERIVRTEVMGAYGRASYESSVQADKKLGGAVKILTATFDNRTAADSYAVHGQIRRPEENFDTWQGPVMFPPARPNDREVVVTHRHGWKIPPYLKPKSPAEIAARWTWEGRKGSHPPIPRRSTVPSSTFR